MVYDDKRDTPMCHSALLDAKFFEFLERIDEDEAARTRAGGCPKLKPAAGPPYHHAKACPAKVERSRQ